MLERVQSGIRTARDFLQDQVWETEISNRPWLEAFGLRQLRVGIIVAKGITQGGLALRASAMTFTTLLTVVPLLIISFSIFRAVGGLPNLESQLEKVVFDNIMPGQQQALQRWVEDLLVDVKHGAFNGISLLFLAGGVLGLLTSIEGAFNDIWGVRHGRSLFQKFSTYTTIIVSAPLLIAISLSQTASLQSSTLLSKWQSLVPGADRLVTLSFQFLPIVLTGIALTLLYTVMPNIKVRLRAALPAGIAAAIIWEFSKLGFAQYLKQATHIGAIYGPLAALPLFFLWVYISWTVVLFGAQLTFAQDAADDIREEELAGTVSLRERIRVAIHLSIEACRRYSAGTRPPELTTLSHRLGLPLRLIRQVTETLTEGGILNVVQNRGNGGIAPARSPETISVYEVIECIVNHGHVPRRAPGREAVVSHVDGLVREIDQTLQSRWADVSMEDCVEADFQPEEVVPFPARES